MQKKKLFNGSYIYQNVNSIQDVLYAGIFCVLSEIQRDFIIVI